MTTKPASNTVAAVTYQLSDPEIRTVMRAAGAKLAGRTIEIADDTMEQLVARRVADFRPGRPAFASMEGNLRAAFSRLEQGTTGVGAPPAALLVAQDFATAGLDDKSILEIYHVGHALIWERWVLPALVAECSNTSILGRCAQIAHRDLFDYLNQVAHEVMVQVRSERFRSSGTSAALDVVTGVLAGLDPGADIRGYPLATTHLAFICWVGPEESVHPIRDVSAAAASLCDLLGADRQLLVPNGSREIFGWASVRAADYLPGRSGPEEDTSLEHPTLDVVALSRSTAQAAPSVHVALGSFATGLEGFRLSHDEALHAKDYCAATDRDPPSFTRYETVAYEALLVSDRSAARRYARRQLEDLSGDSERMQVLRDTALTFLQTGRSYSRTARALGVHRNTVLYRLRKVEQLLHRRLDAAAPEIHAALVIANSLNRSDR